MNNVYHNNTSFYPSRPEMCFDNKGMVNINTAPSERTNSPTVRVNIPASVVSDKTLPTPNKQSSKVRIGRRITVPFVSNAFIAVFVISLIGLLEFGYVPANQQGYYCKDPQISYKYKGEFISPLTLGLGSLFLALIALILSDVLSKRSYKNLNTGELWYYFRECVTGCIFVLLLTEIGKVLVGENRPHFFDVCQPDNAESCTPNSYVETYTCMNPNYSKYFMTDTSRSFPSGHASISFFIGTFSAYVIQTRLSTIHTGRLLKPLLISICFTWSLVCSLSRITDRRHHWWDVLVGTILGIIGALHTIKMVHKKMVPKSDISKVSTSTTTLLDIKNKDATSVII